jgi:hypothetical protein
MSPILMTIAKGTLIIVFLTAFVTAGWANWRMTNRMRDSGFYKIRDPGFANPKTIFAQWGTKEFPVFVLAVLVGAGAIMALEALK